LTTFNKFNCFVADICNKVHNLGADVLQVALCATANAPVATNTVLANLTQVAYTNLSTQVITIISSTQTSGTYKLVLVDLVLTASGGAVASFQYIVIFNQTSVTPTDALIGWYNYGSALTLADGDTFTIDFDGANGVIQIV
jgi:hypothetical protein